MVALGSSESKKAEYTVQCMSSALSNFQVKADFSVNKNLSFLFDLLFRRMYKKVKFIFIVIVKM